MGIKINTRKWLKMLIPVSSAILIAVVLVMLLPARVSVTGKGIMSISIGAQVEAQSVSEVISKRDANSKTYLGNGKYSLDTSIGTSWETTHYKNDPNDISEPWKEINNQFTTATLPWNWQMTQDGYKNYVLNDFTAGQVLKFESQSSTITFQPMGLLWANNLNQLLQISMPVNVSPSITNPDGLGTIKWTGGYGIGRNFWWQNTPGQLNKTLEILSSNNLPTPPQYIIDGGNPVLKLDFIFDPSSDLKIFVDGKLWDKSSKKETVNRIEFKKAERLWVFNPVSYWDSSANVSQGIGTTILSKTGQSLYVSVLVPYSWLQTAVYPVYIDPTVELFPSQYRYFHADAWNGDLKWLLDVPDGVAPASSNVALSTMPTFKAAGTFTAGTSTITPPYPIAPNVPVLNDIAILVCESENQTISLTTAQGFVELGSQLNKKAGGTVDPASRLAVYWKRCVGGDTAPLVADAGDHTTGRIYLFSGVTTTGNPWNVYAEGNDSGANDTTGVVPGATTTVDDCLIFLISTSSKNGASTAEFASWTNANLGSITERGDNTNTAGLGGGHGSATGTLAVKGAYANTTVTLATTSYKGAMSIALAPVLGKKLIRGFASEAIIADNLSAGNWGFFLWGKHDGTTVVASLFAEVRKNSSSGALIATTDYTSYLTTSEMEYQCSLEFPQTAWVSGDKVWVGVYASITTSETGKKAYFYYDHSTRLSRVIDADITIESNAQTVTHELASRGGPFWTSPTVGYVIYIDVNSDLVYRKTSDGGATWAAANVLVTGTIIAYDAWADWQTAGDAGTKIHIACIDTDTDDVLYVYLDTSDNSEFIDTIELCQGTGSIFSTTGRNYYLISITKARGGNLAVAFYYVDSGSTFFYGYYTSPDGDTWASRASPWESAREHLLLFPANLANNQDLWAVFWDFSANVISLKTFDNSLNDWTTTAEASIATAMVENVSYLQMDGAIRLSDGHLILAAWSVYAGVTSDLMVWDITNASTITAKTNIITNEANTFLCSVFINQNTNDIYVAYVSGSAVQDTVAVFYQKSTDGGANWGGETAMQADAEDDERWISCGAVKVAWGGKFQPVWFNDDLNDIFTNTDNGISIAEAGGGEVIITNTPASIDFGTVAPNLSFWSYNVTSGYSPNNPLTDGQCKFLVSNNGTSAIDIDYSSVNFTGGVGWLLGTPSATTARLTVYKSGDNTTSGGVILTGANQEVVSSLNASSSVYWDIKLETPTDYTDNISKTTTIVLTGRAP